MLLRGQQPPMQKQALYFSNGKQAWFVRPPRGTDPQTMIQMLGIQPPPAVILNLGGTSNITENQQAQLANLYLHGLVPTVLETGAAVIDGGTQAGIIEMTGQGFAQQAASPVLLGVAPAQLVSYPGSAQEQGEEKVPLDPHHSHFVLVEGEQWGDETNTLFAVAHTLAQKRPVLTILANGGTIALQEALHTVRHGWLLLIIEGSGRLADTLATAWREQSADIGEPEIHEIITRGKISLFPIDGGPKALSERMRSLLDML